MARSILQTILLALFVGQVGAAAFDSRVEQLQAVEKEVSAAESALHAAYVQMTDRSQEDVTIDRLRDALRHKREAGVQTVLRLAQDDPASAIGFRALEWLVVHGIDREPSGPAVLDLMRRYHSANPQVARAASDLAIHPPYGLPGPQDKSIPRYSDAYLPAIDLLKAILANNADRTARAQAALGLAIQSKNLYLFAKFRARSDANMLKGPAERALNDVIREYNQCPNLSASGAGDKTIGDRARADLREMDNLQPGEHAPEIAGRDLNGTAIKLTECRGKVVLLVFWASWCGPCMAQIPHERELLERLKGRPFCIFGVNADSDQAQAARTALNRNIPFPSVWDGPDGWGPTLAQWNIHSLPSCFVIDADGVIRNRDLVGRDLDEPIAKLVAETDARDSRSSIPQ